MTIAGANDAGLNRIIVYATKKKIIFVDIYEPLASAQIRRKSSAFLVSAFPLFRRAQIISLIVRHACFVVVAKR